jgi:hypothetical protein
MLRALVAVLLIANLAFWAWSAGLLDGLGLGPSNERDPARLAQQIHPEAVRVLPSTAAAAAVATRSAGPAASAAADGILQCLEAGPFAASAVDAAERALTAAGLPAGSWVRTSQDIAAVHAVVLGPYSNREALQKKREELGRLRLTSFEALDLPADGAAATPQPGFALGRFDTRAAAEAALADFNQRGVRTARVVQLRAAGGESRLRIEGATAAQAEQLRGLSAAVLGAGFAPCAGPTPVGPNPPAR